MCGQALRVRYAGRLVDWLVREGTRRERDIARRDVSSRKSLRTRMAPFKKIKRVNG